nr:c-type cytochrome [Bacteroidota bacterium]
MKSKIKSVLTVTLVAAACSFATVSAQAQAKGKPWPAPESAAKVKNPQASNAENLAEGKTLYMKHCKSCHGAKGKGDGPKSANLDVSSGDFTTVEFQKKSDGELYWKTTEGRDPMPSFKKKITDDERWKIIAFMKTLGEK